MTPEGSAMFGAQWKTRGAKLIAVPAIPDAMPEFTTTYDICCSCAAEGYWSHLYAVSHDLSSREDDAQHWPPGEPEREADSVVQSMWYGLSILDP